MKSTIGPYTKIKHIEKGNGADLHRIFNQQMIPMATWRKQKIHKQDKWKQKTGTLTKEACGGENREKYLTTWTSPNGNISRQIDYIMINAKRRNIVKKHKTTSTGMETCIRTSSTEYKQCNYTTAMQEIQKQIPAETSKHLKCDMKELRERPGGPRERIPEAPRTK